MNTPLPEALARYLAERDAQPRGIVRLAASTGKGGWLQRDPNAGYLMDQAWHKGWILVAALVAASGEQR